MRSKSKRLREFERKEKSRNLCNSYLSPVLALSLPGAQFEFEKRWRALIMFFPIFSHFACNCALLVVTASDSIYRQRMHRGGFFQEASFPCTVVLLLLLCKFFCAKPEFQFPKSEPRVVSIFKFSIHQHTNLFLGQSE